MAIRITHIHLKSAAKWYYHRSVQELKCSLASLMWWVTIADLPWPSKCQSLKERNNTCYGGNDLPEGSRLKGSSTRVFRKANKTRLPLCDIMTSVYFQALLLSSHPSLGGLRNMKCLKWPILYREVRKYYSPAAVTMATGWGEETKYLVQSRANWTFRDTSSYCSPETGGRTTDAHTSFRSIPPYNCTYHSYTGRDLPGKRSNI